MNETVATQITREEARTRLLSRFKPWPNVGYRLSNAPGNSANVTDDGFVVRGLPRFTSAPSIEAVGRWSDRGAEIELRPMVAAYLPSMLVNGLVVALAITANVTLLATQRAPLETALPVLIPFVAGAIVVSLVLQWLILAYLVWRNGDCERREIMALLRETLGP